VARKQLVCDTFFFNHTLISSLTFAFLKCGGHERSETDSWHLQRY
jgi:hypothetical protein